MYRLTSLIILLVLSGPFAFSQRISYQLGMPKPQNHYFKVQLTLSDFKEETIVVKMPVWAPGSYLVREFAKNVDLVKAFDENSKPLKVSKTSKNAWSIVKGKAKQVRINYDVYAFELSVRTSFLDLTHGFVSGSGIFMYVDKHKDRSGTLEIVPPSSFKKVTTSLPIAKESVQKDGSFDFTFDNYDQLVDCPIEIGNHETFTFEAAGVAHTVAIYGIGNHQTDVLQQDMAHMVETATSVFGENPNKQYTFIIHNVVDGQGGLEHSNSCTLSVNRWTYEGEEYRGFLSLVAHEYFHLWNVKRIRPIELGPFNYDEENYTTLLWVMEGFTSYYDELLLRRAGIYSKEEYLRKIEGTINYVENAVGSRVQPVAHSSFDAWIKGYRPNENSANTGMTYYSRGQMLAALIDAKIIANSKGTKCLDHFLQHLYKKYYKEQNRGFSDMEFKQELASFLNEDMDDFYARYIDGTEVAPIKSVLEKIGVEVSQTNAERSSFGATIRQENGKALVKGIRANSAAENAGLSVNDEVIGCDGFRMESSDIDAYISSIPKGQAFTMLVARNELYFELKATMGTVEKIQFSLRFGQEKELQKLNDYWLRTL
jgi:predicted metalloprotease with PDZ domain